MAYDADRPELSALEELEGVLALVAEELGGWRARALKAEQELQALLAGAGPEGVKPGDLSTRLTELEAENRDLRLRVERARERVTELMQRLGFLEQQVLEGTGGRA